MPAGFSHGHPPPSPVPPFSPSVSSLWSSRVEGEGWGSVSSGPMDERRQKHQKEKGMGEGEDFPFQVAIHFLLNNLKSHTICEPED